MASGGKAKKMRGNHTHGRGKKAGRGAGLKGGRGRAGANKHRYLMLQVLGGKHAHTAARPWGRIGFKYRSRDGNPQPVSVNVGDLALEFPGSSEIDLTAAGYGKLLGSGNVTTKLTVKVESASVGAVSKIKAAGGSVVMPEGAKAPGKAVKVPPPAPAGKGAPAKPAAPKADKPKADKQPKADKPKGDKPAK